jgi:hypothetical protein
LLGNSRHDPLFLAGSAPVWQSPTLPKSRVGIAGVGDFYRIL